MEATQAQAKDMNKSTEKRTEWEDYKTFEDKESGLIVKVKRLPLKYPKFRLGIFNKLQDGRIVPNFDILLKYITQGGTVEMGSPLRPLIEALERIDKDLAPDIYKTASSVAEKAFENRLRWEQKSMKNGQQEMRRTGKTERKKNKGKKPAA